MADAATRLAALAGAAAGRAAPAVVGIAGAVASGKSTLARAVADALVASGTSASVVTTDGFLLPNAVLAARGLTMHKGFPESYDVDALVGFVDAFHAGAPDVRVPVYSHVTYDVEPGPGLLLGPCQVAVVEGVNTLGALAGRLDLAVYLDAAEADLERWYVHRFRVLCAEARADPSSFYRTFVSMAPDEVDAIALSTWRGINLVNLRDHILPTRDLADVVVTKGSDHQVLDVEVREHAGPGDEGSAT
ncbi:MAG: type I pantothenate kinase [Acidimicrobiia bacterium]